MGVAFPSIFPQSWLTTELGSPDRLGLSAKPGWQDRRQELAAPAREHHPKSPRSPWPPRIQLTTLRPRVSHPSRHASTRGLSGPRVPAAPKVPADPQLPGPPVSLQPRDVLAGPVSLDIPAPPQASLPSRHAPALDPPRARPAPATLTRTSRWSPLASRLLADILSRTESAASPLKTQRSIRAFGGVGGGGWGR